MEITPIGFGAWAIGGPWKYGWGRQDDTASIRTIHAALDAGVNWIDTAAVYGLGHSEEIVAKALRATSAKPYVFTKCSLVWDTGGAVSNCLQKQSIRREVEDSLKRLNLETIDLYQIHWPNPDADIEEGWQTLSELQAEGKLRWIGVSNFSVDQLKRCAKIAPVTSNQPPLNPIRRAILDDVLPYCAESVIGVIVYSPMASGLLTGAMSAERVAKMDEDDWRKGAADFTPPQLARNLQLADLLADIGANHNATAGEVSVAWTLAQPGVTAAIVGMRSPEQVQGVIHGGELTLSQEEQAKIAAFLATL